MWRKVSPSICLTASGEYMFSGMAARSGEPFDKLARLLLGQRRPSTGTLLGGLVEQQRRGRGQPQGQSTLHESPPVHDVAVHLQGERLQLEGALFFLVHI